MEKVKLSILFVLSRFINEGFKNLINRLFSLTFMGSILCFIFSNDVKEDISLVFIFSLLLSISIKRVSNNFILSLLTGHLSMSLKHPKEYRKYSYKHEKDKISNKLKEEFISGIIEASKYRKILRLTTHSWVVKNVVLDDRVKERFNINLTMKKKIIIPVEVMSLISRKEAFSNSDFTLKQATRKRQKYHVVLERKQLLIKEVLRINPKTSF